MGVYQTYIDGSKAVQLKLEDDYLDFNVGDKVNIEDGLYAGYEGIVVIKDKKFVGIFETLTDKWGCSINLEEAINNANPVTEVIKSMKFPND